MKELNSNYEIEELIKNNIMSIVYFTGSRCGACEAIKIKIEEIIKKYPEIKTGEINGEDNLEIAAKYNVFSVPISLLYIEGKESLRIGRNVNLLELERNIQRYYHMIYSEKIN